MSLVNAMLRDLDERHVDGLLDEGEKNIKATFEKPPSKAKSYILSATIALAGAYTLMELKILNLPGISISKPVAPSDNVIPASLPIASVEQPVGAPASNNTNSNTPNVTTGIETTKQKVVVAENNIAPTTAVSLPETIPVTQTIVVEPVVEPAVTQAQAPVLETKAQEITVVEPVVKAVPSQPDRQKFKTQTAIVAGTASAPKARPQLSAETQKAIQVLLIKAGIALEDNRLTLPVRDNAYALYRNALLLDPENAEALAGIASIQERYQFLFDKALDKRHWITANSYIQRAKSIGVSFITIDDMRDRLAESKAAGKRPATNKSTQMAAVAPSAELRKPAEKMAPKNIATAPKVAPALNSAPAASEKRVAVFQQKTDNNALRQDQLERFNKIDMAINTGNLSSAESLLRFETQLPQGRYNYLRAKWLVANNHYQQAVQLLENRSETGEFAFTYYNYLAALHQQLAQYDSAIKIYRTLLAMKRDSVDAWLGLGISLDAKGDTRDALDAYRSAHTIGHRDQAVQRFISQRIAALTN